MWVVLRIQQICNTTRHKSPIYGLFKLLNEIYTNPDLANILINGLEGTHYEFTDKDNGVINYPDGVTASNTGYTSLPWAWPNEAISYVWEGNDPDIWDQTQEFNNNAVVSPAKGFAWDNTDVQNEGKR